jgi:toxin HigB-1
LDFAFRNKKVEALYLWERHSKDYPEDVVTNFFEIMAIIENAKDERDFYAVRSLHFEKLGGKLGREGKRSMRLTKQWRLIISLEIGASGNYVVVWSIDKHRYR